jgi:UDP-sugar transporter A1/2/3
MKLYNKDDDIEQRAHMLPTHMSASTPTRALGTAQSGPSSSASSSGGFSPFQLMLLALMVLQNTCTVLLGRYSQNRPGGSTFATKDLVFMTEFTKMVTCLLLISLESLPPPYTNSLSLGTLPMLPLSLFKAMSSMLRKPLEALRVAPPALLYLVQNNILFVALKNLKAPVFQVTYQSKLVTTALVSVVLLGRKYHGVQWLALVLLGVGVAVVVLGEAGEAPKEASEEASDQSIPLGLIAVTVACLSSAFAGVYFEKVLKGSTTSLWMRNVQLAFISVCLSLAQTAVLGSSENAQGNQRAFLEGFDGVAWTLVCLQAFGGLLVAAIVKYADNVVKGLATGVSVVFATTLSVLFLGTALTINFVVGAVVILASVWVFSNHKRALEIVGRRE